MCIYAGGKVEVKLHHGFTLSTMGVEWLSVSTGNLFHQTNQILRGLENDVHVHLYVHVQL